jgi:hypothetical protein
VNSAGYRQYGLLEEVTPKRLGSRGIYGVLAMSIYSASKFALEGISEAVSYELASQNIVLKLIQNVKLKRRRNMSAARSFFATSAVIGFQMC